MLAIPKSGPIARTTMAYVLAGGRGSRLMELTDRRAKPAVYFGCKSRIIDFALSNALNSGIRRIGVATQYKAHSLIRHLQRGWNFFRVERNESFDILPASQRVSETEWYAGTADAVYQNIDIIESYGPDHIIILGGDHVYKMDYEPMLQMHHERQADVTVGCIEVPREEATAFGVMAVDRTDRIISFLEKPQDPPGMPDKPDKSLASMGIYVFATKFLFDQLKRDAADPNSSRDFGKDLIPYLVKHGKALVHRFTESCVRSGFEADAYWRDVGTLDTYWQANIDLTDTVPALDLYDREWPIWTYGEVTPPAKFVHDHDGRRGQAVSSLVSGGCIVSGASLRHSLLFTGVHVHSFANIENTVVMPYVDIARSARLRNVIIDRGVKIPEGLVVGDDPAADAERFRRTDQGVCLITQEMLDRLKVTAPINVLAVVSEIFPLVKTGGLADVAGALPGALAAEGVNVRSLVPGYPPVLNALEGGVAVANLDNLFGGPARIVAAHASGLDLFVIDAPHLYARDGDPYRGPDGRDWPDNAFRFAALSRVAMLLAHGLVDGYRPDIVHAHDWQAGPTPAYMHYAGANASKTVMTIHNLSFQGQFPPYLLALLGLPADAFSINGVEYYGAIGYLKAGLQFADRITTVSPTYATEICTPAHGMGMDGLLRTRAGVLSGILNGIDTAVWDPAHDPHLAATFDANRLARRAANKAALQERFGLQRDPAKLLFGVISRLSAQKGIDLVLAALPALVGGGGQLVVLGAGEAPLEAGLRAAAGSDVRAQIGYDEGLAHLIQGGCDALLMPSHFEPCGLTQLCAMRYGTLPVVAHVGGLCDTVIDANEMALAAGVGTGFHFAPVQTEMLAAAILRVLSMWRQPEVWRSLQRNAMQTDVSWRRPAARYATLYRELCPATTAPPVIARSEATRQSP